MNKENIQKAINVMQRVVDRNDKVYMPFYQDSPETFTRDENGNWQIAGNSVCRTEEDLHTCGTTACFSGWLAVSPEWKEFGGIVTGYGSARLPANVVSELGYSTKNPPLLEEAESLAVFLGINVKLSGDLIDPSHDSNNIYGKNICEIGAKDIVRVLTDIRDGKIDHKNYVQ